MLSHQTGSKKRRRDVDQSATSSGERGTGIRPLVLCINTTGEEDLFLDALMADGVPPNRLPEVGGEGGISRNGVQFASIENVGRLWRTGGGLASFSIVFFLLFCVYNMVVYLFVSFARK